MTILYLTRLVHIDMFLPCPKLPPARPHASFMGRTAPSVLRSRRRRDGRLHDARQEESEHTRNPCPPSASRVVNYPTLSIEIGQISVLKSIFSVKTAAAALVSSTKCSSNAPWDSFTVNIKSSFPHTANNPSLTTQTSFSPSQSIIPEPTVSQRVGRSLLNKQAPQVDS